MLLRSSRAASRLTKEALVGALIGKGVAAVGRNSMKVLGGGVVASTAAPEINEGTQRAKLGLRPEYLEAANAGMVPSVPRFQ